MAAPNPTVVKWDVKSLETSFSMEMIKLCFPEELAFIQKNNWRFLQNKPAILTALNGNSLNVSALLEVRRLLNTEIEEQRVAKEVAERDAKDDADRAERKAQMEQKMLLNPASLTGNHRHV